MAKLSAHGYELARVEFQQVVEHTDGTDSTTYRVILSFRSDGHIMRRLVALNIHDTRYGGSPHADFGWKLYKRFKPEVRNDMDRLREIVAKRVVAYERQHAAVSA